MIPGYIWLTKLILSHLITDFILQPSSWVEERNRKHFASRKLYWHALVTAVLACIFIGWQYWLVALTILITHFLIDGWKSYRPQRIRYFIIDQILHMVVIVGCWMVLFQNWNLLGELRRRLSSDEHGWIILAAFVFVTTPAGIMIGQLTGQWSKKIDDPEETLANAGKWIGIAERVIVLIFVLLNQYSVIGLVIAAKSILRFSEKDRPEVKTEYILIGTLLSIGIAILTGLFVKRLT